MLTSKPQIKLSDEDEEFLTAMRFPIGAVLPMVLKAAIELDLFEIMAKTSPGGRRLSSSEIASQLPTRNPEAPVMLDRMLRFLASNSILTCTLNRDENGDAKRSYGLTPICKYFVRDQHGVSLSPSVLFLQDKVVIDCWYHLKDAIIDGGIPFNKAHGMHAFEYPEKDSRFNEVFNKAMYNHTTMSMNKILETYKGFEGIQEIVDVGGGFGATLGSIVSKHPNIRGINFDLPHVIKDAPPCSGVEHVGGDMFESVPKGEAIFMKWILHDWSDDHCLKLLKNCWNALPDSGKVIAVESILPEYPETDLLSQTIIGSDMVMLTLNPGGKERTEKEYEALVKAAGFAALKLICCVQSYWIMEFYKKCNF
ncbi:unnamed protein product [Ilex paraguariensis]|uniref:Caffeic acid O-methyltransferase n=1 Tax=Ilex paraguariensis TaxID=185542 RepID=A0ABC8TG37_9AQUA